MSIFKLSPVTESFEWGGEKLKDYGIEVDGSVAQAWELCANGENQPEIVTGPFAGMKLGRYLEEHKDAAGELAKQYDYFPLTVKLVDNQKLTALQVNPDPDKIHLIYVLDAKEDALIYYGFNEPVTREALEEKVQDGSLNELIRSVKVKAGDSFLIEPGTVFAIGEDVQYVSIQQDSPLKEFTFEQVLNAVNLDVKNMEDEEEQEAVDDGQAITTMLANTDVFATFKTVCDGEVTINQEEDSFGSLLLIDGTAVISLGNETIHAKKGDSLFIDAGTRDIRIVGNCTYLYTFLSENDD